MRTDRWMAFTLAALLGLSTGCEDDSVTDPRADETGGQVAFGPIVVMTYNILCSACNVGGKFDPWEQRLQYIQDTIARHAPDLIGLQELMSGEQVNRILARLPEYEALYFREEGRVPESYPDATIFYRRSRFDAVEHGFYWLSPKPDTPYTAGFAGVAQMWRLVAWVHLRQKDGRNLYFANTHFDNNAPSQERSAPLLLSRTEPWAGRYPVIVAGDFNSRPNDPAYRTLVEGVDGSGFSLVNAFDIADQRNFMTNLAPPPAYDTARRIDHIFVGGADWVCQSWRVDQYAYGKSRRFASDHFAVSAAVDLR